MKSSSSARATASLGGMPGLPEGVVGPSSRVPEAEMTSTVALDPEAEEGPSGERSGR